MLVEAYQDAQATNPGNFLAPGVDLTVVIPTRNERDNIQPLYDRLSTVLENVSWEVIFVDDDF